MGPAHDEPDSRSRRVVCTSTVWTDGMAASSSSTAAFCFFDSSIKSDVTEAKVSFMERDGSASPDLIGPRRMPVVYAAFCQDRILRDGA